MKKVLSIAAVMLMVLIVVLVVPTKAAAGDVLFVSDAGSASNSGASPDKALNSLTDAIASLPESGGTVVLCGDVTLRVEAPVFAAKSGKVTVTGVYDGVDYDPAIKLSYSGGMYLQFLSLIEFNNLAFNRTNTAWCEFITGPELIIGENVAFLKNGEPMVAGGNCMTIRLGYADTLNSPGGQCENASLQMRSGSVNYIQGGNKWNDVGKATIALSGTAAVTDILQCGGTNFDVDDVTLSLDGVNIPALYLNGYGAVTAGNVTVNAVNSTIGSLGNNRNNTSATITGNVSLELKNCELGKVAMTYGSFAGSARVELAFREMAGASIADGLAWVDSLALRDNSALYIQAAYAGPSNVEIGADCSLTLSNTRNTTAPAGASLAHNYVMTLGAGGSYTLTCTNKTCGKETVTKTAGELAVVYFDATAATCGDGSNPDHPVNTLDAAYARIRNEGGTIVVMGDLTLDCGTFTQWPTKTGKVILTGTYGSVKYAPTVTFYGTANHTLQFRSAVEFRHMTFNRTYGTNAKYTQFFPGPDLTFGEGMVMLDAGNAMGTANVFVVRCGYAADAPSDQTTQFTMLSGTLNFLQGGNHRMDSGSADIYLGSGVKILEFVQAGGTSYTVNGNVNIAIDGATVPVLYISSYNESNINGNVTVDLKNVTGLKVAQSRLASDYTGTVGKISGNVTIRVENSTLSGFALQDQNFGGDLTVEMKKTTVSANMYLGKAATTLEGDLRLCMDGCTVKALATHYPISGNAVFELKNTVVTNNMRLAGNVAGTVAVTLDNATAGSGLQYVQDANAKSFALTLKNVKNDSCNSSLSTVDSLTLENAAVIMAVKYEGPSSVAVGDGSRLYISSANAASEVPSNSLSGTGKVVYLATGYYEKGDAITMRYDDRLDVSEYFQVSVIKKGTPTSYQVGYGVTANSVKDTAVITYDAESKKLIATGVGTATVLLGGAEVKITVEPAPISLFLMIGQSNMVGFEGDPDQSVVCEEGQVYSTWAEETLLTTKTATQFVASALAGSHKNTNREGGTTYLEDHPLNALTIDGPGKKGMDGGLGYEWAKLTGQKVWMVNAAHGATSMGDWVVMDGDNDNVTGKEFKQLKAIFNAVLETMTAEIKAGHYTLENYAYFWCQGCTDRVQSADWYLDKFSTLHQRIKEAFVHDFGDGKGNRTLESANIVLVRACGTDGMNSLEPEKKKDYFTYHDLEMNGIRTAQYYMANSTEKIFQDVHMVSNIGDQWVWWDEAKTQETTSAFFAERYPNGIDYPIQVGSLEVPSSPDIVKDSIHYNQVGFNEVGREVARNTAYRLYPELAPDEDVSIKLLGWDGVTDLAGKVDTNVLTENQVVVPVVYPLYRSKELVLSGDMLHDYSVNNGTKKDFVYYSIPGARAGTVTATVDDVSVSYTLDPAGENRTFRWETVGGKLTAVTGDGLTANALTLLTGTNNGSLAGASFALAETVVLRSDVPWVIEWQGAVTNPEGSSFMLLAASSSPNTLDAPNIIMSSHSVVFNRRLDESSMYVADEGEPRAYNYMDHLRAKTAIDMASTTAVYRLINEVAPDGSNMIYLYINGVKKAAVNSHHGLNASGVNETGVESNAISGVDLVFGYIGAKSPNLASSTDHLSKSYDYTLTGTLKYLQVQENRLKKTEAKAATCVSDGCEEYYTDPLTGKIYADASGLEETTLEDLKIPATHKLTHVEQKKATATEPGNIEYWHCEICGKFFSDADAANEISEAETVIPATGEETGILGDADGDGYIDAYDASLIVKYSVGAIADTALNLSVLDLDGDGYVDAYDASLIQKYSVGAIDKFPVEE